MKTKTFTETGVDSEGNILPSVFCLADHAREASLLLFTSGVIFTPTFSNCGHVCTVLIMLRVVFHYFLTSTIEAS